MHELRLHGFDQLLQGWEVSIVRAQSPRQFPDALDRIELRTVSRQKIQLHPAAARLEPIAKITRVVIRRVIQNQLHPPTGATMRQELLQKISEADPIECLLHPRHQFPIGDTHRAQEAHVLAGRSVQEDGVGFFRGNPHGTAGAVLLKVTFIKTPKVNIIADGVSKEFFYMSPAAQDRHAPEADEVFAVGIPAHEKASGIDEPGCAPDTFSPSGG